MKIAALCCTFLRSHLLRYILKCWQEQDYPPNLCELIILDDAGEYKSQTIGANCHLVSFPRRFTSLGEKRNASAALASPDVDAFAIWDDDDLYLPTALSASAKALHQAPLSRPSQVLYHRGGAFHRHWTGGLYHGGWAFSRELFRRVAGYRYQSGPEDQELLARMLAAGAATADPLADGTPPFYVYQNDTNSPHISWIGGGDKIWQQLGRPHNGFKDSIEPAWPFDLRNTPILDPVHPRPF